MPESASFSVRRPNYRRRRTFTVLGLLAALVVVVVLLTRGGGPLGGPEGAADPDAGSSSAQVKHVFQGKAPARAPQQGEVDSLTDMFSEYYQQAFVDPGAWGDGTFEDLAGLFADDAKASFQQGSAGAYDRRGAHGVEARRPRQQLRSA